MRAASQINAERRNRQKSTQVLVRFYADRPEDAALLEALDAARGDVSRAEALKAAAADQLREQRRGANERAI